MANRQDGSAGWQGTALVVIPTYNERDNIGPIVQRLLTALPSAHVLIVDDGSPDGTGEVADGLAAEDERIHVMHRAEKAGLGAAYVAGFDWALQREYDAIIEMDADGSHAPEDLPRLLGRLGDDADVVIGSRYVLGGRVVNWPWYREALSRGANLYTRLALGVAVNDSTAGYRVYRRGVLENLRLHDVASAGYCFQVDLTLRALDAGYHVVEAPITFIDREVGDSKMSGSIAREALVRMTKWGLRRRSAQVAELVRRARR